MFGTERGGRKLRPLAAGVAILFLGLVVGCSDDDGPTEPEGPQYEANTSAEAVLRNLRVAYEERDFGGYDDLFDREAFIFKFAAVDVEGEDPLPPFWDWAEEELAARGLFDSELVQSVDLEFTFSNPEDPDLNQIDNAPAESKMIYLTSLTLIVTQDNPDLGEQDIFIVDGDRHEFFLREYPDEQVNGKATWKIVEWRDRSLGPGNRLATHETTWGKVKTLFD